MSIIAQLKYSVNLFIEDIIACSPVSVKKKTSLFLFLVKEIDKL